MPKILLVNPTIPHRFDAAEFCSPAGRRAISKRVLVGPPLALNLLAAAVDHHQVQILDLKAEQDLGNPKSSDDILRDSLADFQPDIIGLTCLTAQYNTTLRFIQQIKQTKPDTLVVIGGIHPTSAPQDFYASPVDIINIGMGDRNFRKICDLFAEHGWSADFGEVKNLHYQTGGSWHISQTLSDLSYQEYAREAFDINLIPNRRLTDHYDYRIKHIDRRIHYLSTSYGCTNKCNFCYLWKMTEGYFYHRPVDDIIHELSQMDDYYFIRFCDSNTFGDVAKARELFQKIIDHGLQHKHAFMADLRVDMVIRHPDLIQLAARAGLKVVVSGLESCDEEQLKKYNKASSAEDIPKALRIMNEAGLFVNGNYIVRPDFSQDDFAKLRNFILQNPIYNSAFTILTPFPATPQWQELEDQIETPDFDYFNLTNCVLKTTLGKERFYQEMAKLYEASEASSQLFHQRYGDQTPDRPV